MNIVVEYKYYYPELNNMSYIIDKTLKEYKEKYGESAWYIELKYNTHFSDTIKNKTKNLTTRKNPQKTNIASNSRYEYM